MTTIASLTLENEMDLVLAYKKSILVAAACKHTVATQTTFATAVSEVARELIDKTNTGKLTFLLGSSNGRYILSARCEFATDTAFSSTTPGFIYAGKLVAEATFSQQNNLKIIQLSLKIPASSNLTPSSVKAIQEHFRVLAPLTPYEEVKNRNQELHVAAVSKEEHLQQSIYVNERKDEFIAMAGHELKTPLTLVKAYSQLIQQLTPEELQEQGRSFIIKIDEQTNKMQMLIQQLLDLSHIGNGSFTYTKEKVSAAKFIVSLYDMIVHLLPDYIISLDMDERMDCQVVVDRLRMEQVFTNLSGNAAKYSSPGSEIILSCNHDADGLHIKVTDQGIGIAEEHLERIFEKFYRISEIAETYSGLGMGLFITTNILKAHGTELKVESIYGAGTTFYFTLPLAENEVVN